MGTNAPDGCLVSRGFISSRFCFSDCARTRRWFALGVEEEATATRAQSVVSVPVAGCQGASACHLQRVTIATEPANAVASAGIKCLLP